MNNTNQKEISFIVNKATSDTVFRTNLVQESFYWFFHIYFAEAITYPVAEFQKEIIKLVEGDTKNLIFSGFRGCGKSTIISLAYVIWSMIGRKKKKHIVLISHTSRQTKILMRNIRYLLEDNNLLKRDLGPFYEESEEWRTDSLVFKNYKAKIMAVSINESVRGITHGYKRPDLIICDDVETLESTRTAERREKLIEWYNRDITPLGDKGTSIIILGTMMASGALIQTLKGRIKSGELVGIFRKYPIISEGGVILWKEKWPNIESLEQFRKETGIVEQSWQTEYLLNEWVAEDQIITPDMITYYDSLPIGIYPLVAGVIGADLAISHSDSADKTAMVAGYVFREKGKHVLYLLPNPVNKRLNFHEGIEEAKTLAMSMLTKASTRIFVENVGYQASMIEELKKTEGFYNTEGFEVKGRNKRERLAVTVRHVIPGQVRFPKKGTEQLTTQLFGFGRERYNDLVDAFSIVVIKTFERILNSDDPIAVTFIRGNPIVGGGSSYVDWAEIDDASIFRNKRTRRICQFTN